jgi:hypothetical protein
MTAKYRVSREFFGLTGVWLVLLGLLALGAPSAAQAQEDSDSAVFRTGLGVTSLKFVDRSASTSTHQFGIVDFGVSKSFGGFFVGFDTELPFNQGGTPTNNEIVQTSVADFTLGYGFKNQLSVFTGWHYARYDFWRSGDLFSRQTDKGPYLGLGYAFSVGKTGQLSASVAYGDFDSDSGAGPGKSTGTSASLTWSGDFRRGLGYYVKLRMLNYNFELDSTPPSGGRDVRKTITTLAVGLVY